MSTDPTRPKVQLNNPIETLRNGYDEHHGTGDTDEPREKKNLTLPETNSQRP